MRHNEKPFKIRYFERPENFYTKLHKQSDSLFYHVLNRIFRSVFLNCQAVLRLCDNEKVPC